MRRRHPAVLAIAACSLLLSLGAPTARADATVHVVRPGENLTIIAREYGTTVETLVALNGLANPNVIRPGQRLVVGTTPFVHVVQRGETLWDIAKAYGVTTTQIAAWNGLSDPNRILPGQELIVSAQGIYHKVQRGETASEIAARYGVTVEALAKVNQLSNPHLLIAGQTLLIPPVGGGVAEALAAGRALSSVRRFDRWPVSGTISSPFGMRDGRPHEGIDIAVAHGTAVRAVADGVVTYADWAGSYGILVTIDHGGGIETRYAHNSRVTVQVGQRVRAGDVIARSGSTGRSTGPHVHFEVRVDGEALDPLKWLP